MFRSVLITLLLAAASPSTLEAAAPAEAAATSPTAREFFEAIAAGDPARIDAFIVSGFSPKAVDFEPLDAVAKRMRILAEQSGGLDITEWEEKGDRIRFAGLTREGRVPLKGLIGLDGGKLLGFQIEPDRRVRGPGAPAWPARVDTLDAALVAIEQEIDWRAGDGRFSGAVLVARRGEVILDQAWGLARRGPDLPNTPDTLFHTASTTKMLTAAAIGQLIDRGKLSLDTAVADAVPALASAPGAKDATIRDLLGHRVSYGDFLGLPAYRTLEREDLRATDLLPLIVDRAPKAAPTDRISYSNANYLVLAAAIEAATGDSYYDYVRDHILQPTGMADTEFGTPEVRPTRAAIGWIKDYDAHPLGGGEWQANDGRLPYHGGPAGGTWMSARDMGRFLDALTQGRLVEPATLAAMTGDSRTGARTFRHGLGFMLNEANGRGYFGHDGGGGNAGVSTAAFTSLDGEWSVVVLSNYSSGGDDLGKTIMDFLLTALPPE